MGLTRPITRELTQILPRQLWRGLGIGKVEQILADARVALNIHPAQQVGSAYLVQKTPTLAGVVQDETPTRKDRTRLSCRASDFDGINQRFSGGNTSTSKTTLSVFAWVRPTTLSGSKTIIGESVESGNDRGWLIYFDGSNLRVIVSADGGATNAKNYVTTSSFTVGEWINVGFVFGSGALTLYVDGKAAAVTQTTNGTVAAINDSAQAIELASTNGGANYLTGQIQQPLIWESALTAAEVRDLYLQQYDDITAPDYGWFLDADSAYGLTSSSPALTPSNSPNIYEDDAIGGGDWLNEKGYNLSGVDPIPKRWDEELDSNGNGPDNENSFGVARRDGQLEDGPCVDLNGVNQYGVITNTDDYSGEDWVLKCRFVADSLVGIENVFSQDDGGGAGRSWLFKQASTLRTTIGGAEQTFSNTLSAAKEYYVELEKSSTTLTLRTTNLTDGDVQTDSVTATMESAGGNLNLGVNKIGTYLFDGKIWGLELDCTTDSSKSFNCPISEGSGTTSDDAGNGKDIAWQNSPTWGNQSSYFWNENQGCSLYEHATSPDILVPFGSDGAALTITPPSGYTKTSDNPAGPWLYDGLGDTYINFDVVPNANQWLEQRWQGTEGDGIGRLTLDSLITLAGAFDIEFSVYASNFDQAGTILGNSSLNRIQLTTSGTGKFAISINGNLDTGVDAPSNGEWHDCKLSRDANDIATLTVDGTENTLYSGAAASGNMLIQDIFHRADLTEFTGQLRNIKIIDNGTTVLDFAPLIDLDLSSSLNNATETATDITYNRLTDVSYQAGDTVEQPFSLNDDTAGRVSELIQFTFPITTLSSTPTISQTVYEDGNTVTQDGILISES